MTVIEWISNQIETKYNSQSEFARATGMPLTTLRSILSRDFYRTSVKLALNICKELKVDINDLSKDNFQKFLRKNLNTVFLPMPSFLASAGFGDYIPQDNNVETVEVVKNEITGRATFVQKISGNSMEPVFHDGDIVAVEYTSEINVGQIGIFDIDGERFIKRCGNDGIEPLNPKYDTITPTEFSNMRCVGVVLGKVEVV